MRQGFTLIEVSIVLVIIGLIVGGVLVGQDLIKAAKLRSTISQLERYNTAVNTFEEKYSGLPGDLMAKSANSYGFAPRAGTLGHGDGNGLIKGGWGGGNTYAGPDDASCGEISLFWNDLSTAHMIEGTFQGIDGEVGINCNASSPHRIMPVAPIGNGVTITVYGDSDTFNYFYLACDVSNIDSSGGWTCSYPTINPSEAYALDTKADDGMPLSGSVQATSGVVVWNAVPVADTPSAPAPGVCTSNASGNPYNTNPNTGGLAPACSIKFRFQ